MDRRRLLLATLLLAALTPACATSSLSVAKQWRERAVAQHWVAARTTMLLRRHASDPFITHVVVSAGGPERIVYRSQPMDRNVSHPVVSRDGTWLAFARVEDVGSALREGLYVVRPDGEDLRPVFELRRDPQKRDPRWSPTPPPDVAWSHDNSALLIRRSMSRPDGHESRLVLLDMQSGASRALITVRPSPDLEPHPVITSQAWAPAGRRFVYTNGNGRAIIVDTASAVEVDLGPGLYPAWSPDGRGITVKNPWSRDAKSRDMGDYFVVAAEPPHDRTLLRENRKASGWYYGPALWSPDGRHVLIRRSEFEWRVFLEVERPYVQEVATGRIGRVPEELTSYSWGGRP